MGLSYPPMQRLAASVAAVFLACAPACALAATIELRGGDRLSGEIVERRADRIVLDHPVLGRVEIPIDQLAPQSAHPGVFGTSVLEGWNKDLAIGFSGSQGDSDESDLVVSLSLGRVDERTRWSVSGRYQLSFSDGDVDDNNANLTTLHDWLWPGSPWFAFTFGLYDYDDFEAWKHRTTVGGGPGRNLVTTESFTLDSRAGPFFTYEFGEEDDARPEVGAGLFATWKVRDGHTVELFNVYFQTLDEGAFRDVTNLAWKIRLDVEAAVSLKLGIRNEYDSASRESENNLRYFTQLAWDL